MTKPSGLSAALDIFGDADTGSVAEPITEPITEPVTEPVPKNTPKEAKKAEPEPVAEPVTEPVLTRESLQPFLDAPHGKLVQNGMPIRFPQDGELLAFINEHLDPNAFPPVTATLAVRAILMHYKELREQAEQP